MIGIVNYGMGNLGSVRNALDYIGADSFVSEDPVLLESADALVLPGVGSFGDAMDNLRIRGLEETVARCISSGKPFLGICLGFQMLFTGSEESPGIKGLGMLDGSVKRFPGSTGLKIPQIGWNSIKTNAGMRLLGESDGKYMYFVHSYYADPVGMDGHIAQTLYGIPFASAVEYENILACQFHPEKSGARGLEILRKWAGSVI
ncbi:MAG: imidazole glycerol phosphate synthase subunit HisH [Clostridia bacterium]|nr:imidazole glycerol phosphate synthase subunit HisH [Clostridia bacterium]